MDNNDSNTMNKRINSEAMQLSAKYKLDEKRVFKVLHKLAEINWYDPDHAIYGELEKAFQYLSPNDALELFEKEDLTNLATRVLLVDYLNDFRTPLYTLNKLATLTNRFIDHFISNQEDLLRTGFPEKSFHKSLWLDIHFNKLYYVKLPIVRRHVFANESTLKFKKIVMEYNWTKEKLPKKFTNGVFINYDTQRPLNYVDVILQNDHSFLDSKFTFCTYEDASLIQGFEELDVERLEKVREKVFKLKIAILKQLHTALTRKAGNEILDNCIKTIFNYLTAEEVSFLLKIDQVYAKMLYGIENIIPSNRKSLIYHNPGLSDLFMVIGHYAKEIELSTMDETYKALKILPEQRLPDSYYRAVGKPWLEDLNDILYYYARLEKREEAFWVDYSTQINKMLKFGMLGSSDTLINQQIEPQNIGLLNQLQVNLPDSQQVNIDITTLGVILNQILKSGGKISINIEPETLLQNQSSDYTFIKRGDYWDIVYRDEETILKHSIGLQHIKNLLENPNRHFYALELYLLSKGELPRDKNQIISLIFDDDLNIGDSSSSYDPKMDKDYRRDITERINELSEMIKKIKSNKDKEKIKDLKKERKDLRKQLRSDTDVRGKIRQFTDDEVRKRNTITKAINRSSESIRKKGLINLARHLYQYIKTSTGFEYDIKNSIPPWKF